MLKVTCTGLVSQFTDINLGRVDGWVQLCERGRRSSIVKCAIYECHLEWAYDGETNFNQSSGHGTTNDDDEELGRWTLVGHFGRNYDNSIIARR